MDDELLTLVFTEMRDWRSDIGRAIAGMQANLDSISERLGDHRRTSMITFDDNDAAWLRTLMSTKLRQHAGAEPPPEAAQRVAKELLAALAERMADAGVTDN